MKMSAKERDALVAALLDMDENDEVREWVLVSHYHRAGEECTGSIRAGGNTESDDETMTLLVGAMGMVMDGKGQGPIDVPDSPEGLS